MRTRAVALAPAAVTGAGLAVGLPLLALNWSTAVPLSPIGGYHAPAGFLVLALTAIIFASVGLVLVWRHAAGAIGWIYGAIGVLGAAEFVGSQYAIYGSLTAAGSVPRPELGAWVYEGAGPVVAVVSATFVLLLFPDGRLPSRAWRPVTWLATITIAVVWVGSALVRGPLPLAVYVENPFGVLDPTTLPFIAAPGICLLIGTIGLSVASLAARYRHATRDTREQIKWIAYAASLHGLALAFYVSVYVSVLGQAGLGTEIVALIAATIPVATAIAVLRYRLYDIDVLINRTLVFGATSAVVAAVFLLGIVTVQLVLRPLTAGSEFSVAASTLLSLVLVQPIRRRVQNAVDRRFHRARYDAARTLDAFAVRLQDEVDIDALRAALLAVVDETMAPAQANLWLWTRDPERRQSRYG